MREGIKGNKISYYCFSILITFMRGRYLWILFLLFSCSERMQVNKVEKKEYVFSSTSNNESDSVILKKIQPYKSQLTEEMSAVLIESVQPIEKALPEGILGDLVADAALDCAKKIYYPEDAKQVDFIFLNNGGLRKALPKGPITRGDIFDVLPFENELVVLTADGGLVRKIVNFIASKGGMPVSGIRFQIKGQEASTILINGAPFDSTRTYKVATIDYLANGGDQFSFLSEAKKKENLNVKLRDAMIQNLESLGKSGKKLDIHTDGRITHER